MSKCRENALIMDSTTIRPGLYKVKIDNILFNLSVVDSMGIIGVAGYFEEEKRPRKGKHLTLTNNVRNWISEMSLIEKLE